MVTQIIYSGLKWKSAPTGISIEYKKGESDLNISLTFCEQGSNRLNNASLTLLNLISVYTRKRELAPWTKYHDEKNHNESNTFIWLGFLMKCDCRTIIFKGNDAKILHSINVDKTGPGMTVLVHDSGNLNSQGSLAIPEHYYMNNNILNLEAEQTQVIETNDLCTSTIDFDTCKDDYLNKELNKTFGCVLLNKRRGYLQSNARKWINN